MFLLRMVVSVGNVVTVIMMMTCDNQGHLIGQTDFNFRFICVPIFLAVLNFNGITNI